MSSKLVSFIDIGGDQLTSARVRGSLIVRSTTYKPQDRLEGLAAVTEDWHAKVIRYTQFT